MALKTRSRRIPLKKSFPATPRNKRGPKPRPIIEFPEPKSAIWADKDTFHEALMMQIERHGETV